ncbi:hypothetical protein CDEST_05986 [Colletotrichum destructivum]|uniref:G-patch domain-containing protein n=1 Tax=Colletotrichum destructivum TaxID=34406 RepID=A0AAX4ICM0_9PEZI|nr:hypothetical protein CDEST_05986 [Colletotrichum destructivum]
MPGMGMGIDIGMGSRSPMRLQEDGWRTLGSHVGSSLLPGRRRSILEGGRRRRGIRIRTWGGHAWTSEDEQPTTASTEVTSADDLPVDRDDDHYNGQQLHQQRQRQQPPRQLQHYQEQDDVVSAVSAILERLHSRLRRSWDHRLHLAILTRLDLPSANWAMPTSTCHGAPVAAPGMMTQLGFSQGTAKGKRGFDERGIYAYAATWDASSAAAAAAAGKSRRGVHYDGPHVSRGGRQAGEPERHA